MAKLIDILDARRIADILAIRIIFLFPILSLVRLYPYHNTLQELLTGTDDWNWYARYALDIKRNGILIPSVTGVYQYPGSFLYNYFIALCFSVFGESVVPVYIIQSILLGFSIVFIYWAFRDKMKPKTALAFLFALFVFALLDVFKYYSFKLLSENIALFTVSAFIYCLIKGIERNKLSLQIASSFFLSLSILIRPNIFPFGILCMMLLPVYFLKFNKQEIWKAGLFVFILTAGVSLPALRNYLVCGSWTFLPATGVLDALEQTNGLSVSFFFRKLLFCFGYLSGLNEPYQIRPHWMLMWMGYFIYLFYRIKEHFKFEIWEVLTQLFIISYYGLTIAFAYVASYGFRIFIPVLFIVLAFSFMGFEKLFSSVKLFTLLRK